jgi:hypothetical protein
MPTFQHGDAHRFLTTWQGRDNSRRSLDRVTIISQSDPHPDDGVASNLPDVPGTGADGGPPFLKYVARKTDITDDFQLKHRGIFGGKLQGHPTDPNHWIMARQGAAYVSKTGTTLVGGPEFQKLELRDDDVELDLVTRDVKVAGQSVELQPREFTLLAYLLKNPGRPVTKAMILEHVWDYSFDPQTNVVDVLVHRLRAKVDPEHTRIETVRGVGYVFKA